MARRYWLDLFTYETWLEFKESGGTTSGFRENRWSRVRQISPGDYLLCYTIAPLKRWIAVLEVTGEPYEASEPRIWASDIFPSRMPVRAVHELTPETGVPVQDLIDSMPMFDKVKDKGPGAWGGFFLGSPQAWPDFDAQIVVAAIRDAEANPVSRPLPRIPKRQAVVVDTDLGKVALPTNDEEDEDTSPPEAPAVAASEHTEMQAILARMGHAMGHQVFVARNDRGREIDGVRLGDMPGVVDRLPTQFNAPTNTIIELIDVLWLNDNAVAAAFEIEKSTSIYSGLLRMSDLLVMQPNLDLPIFLVAPEERRDKVKTEVNRPTFHSLKTNRPLAQVCRYLSFGALREAVETHGDLLRHLNASYVHEDLSESCELDG